tara:strand:+ start:800 stop:1114 length:315 start_codon:yes stop_codon:yes gene_type:complete
VTKKQLQRKIKEIMVELLKNYDLDEITTTGDIATYMTPYAFKKKKKKKKSGFDGGHEDPEVYGYKLVREDLSQQDVVQIRKIIKGVLNDMFRDIWLKRNAWNRI